MEKKSKKIYLIILGIILAVIILELAILKIKATSDKNSSDSNAINSSEKITDIASENTSDDSDDSTDSDSDGFKLSSTEAVESEYYKAFADYLENNELIEGFDVGQYENGSDKIVYTLDYLDEDDIPELFYANTDAPHASNIYILKYDSDSKTVTKYGPFGAYGCTSFYEKNNIICTVNLGMGEGSESYTAILPDGETENLAFKREVYSDDDYSDNPVETYYYVNGIEKTEDEYEAFLENLLPSTHSIEFSCYDNAYGYDYIDDETIEAFKETKSPAEVAESILAQAQGRIEDNEANDYTTNLDMTQAASDEFGIADNCLNEIWAVVKNNATEDEYEKILEEQRNWVADKEEKGQAILDDENAGSGKNLDYCELMLSMTLERCEELVGYLQ